MADRHHKESHFENHTRETELENVAAHATGVAERHGKSAHPTGEEQTRHESEHAPHAHSQPAAPTVGHGIASFGHDDIAALAYEFWKARGGPLGSAEEDWFRAAEELRSRAYAHRAAKQE